MEHQTPPVGFEYLSPLVEKYGVWVVASCHGKVDSRGGDELSPTQHYDAIAAECAAFTEGK